MPPPKTEPDTPCGSVDAPKVALGDDIDVVEEAPMEANGDADPDIVANPDDLNADIEV